MTLTELYEEYELELCRYARRWTRDAYCIDDLVQECFIRAMGHLELLGLPEDIERGVDYLGAMGHVLCPDHLAGAIEAKLQNLRGPMHVYPRDSKPIVGSLTLDERFLRSLDDGSTLMVVGRLNAKDLLPNDLLERKVNRVDRLIAVHNLGRIEGSAEQVAALEFRLGINEGSLKTVSAKEAEEEPESEGPDDKAEYVIDNIVNLKL